MFQVKKKISPTSIKMFVRNEDSTESFLCYGTVKILETCFFFFLFCKRKIISSTSALNSSGESLSYV